jgi:hypothetical protein
MVISERVGLSMSDDKIQVAKVASLGAEVRYPLGLADLEYALLDSNGQPALGRTTVRFIVTEEEAQRIGEHFIKLADTLRQLGGSKQ